MKKWGSAARLLNPKTTMPPIIANRRHEYGKQQKEVFSF
jgi:hypothetical protein